MPRATSLAFIGLGRMGFPMARNLFASHLPTSSSLIICDAHPPTAHTFANQFKLAHPNAPITVVDTPEQATRQASTIFTMLPSSPQVQQVYTGESSVVSALEGLGREEREETLCVDSTTLDLDVARAVSTKLTSLSAHLIDAPVSGGVPSAHSGTLTLLLGTPAPLLPRLHTLLLPLSSSPTKLIHCGPPLSGLAAKLINNLVLGVQQAVVGEAMLLSQKMGMDPRLVREVLGRCTGACWSVGVNNPVPGAVPIDEGEGEDGDTNTNTNALKGNPRPRPRPPCETAYTPGFATSLMLKDLRLALHCAQHARVPTPLAEHAERIYAQVVRDDPECAGKDFSVVYRFLERVADGEALLGEAGWGGKGEAGLGEKGEAGLGSKKGEREGEGRS